MNLEPWRRGRSTIILNQIGLSMQNIHLYKVIIHCPRREGYFPD